MASLLVGLPPGQSENRSQQNHEIEPQRPIVDVLDIRLDTLDHLLDIPRLPAIAAHLSQTGHSRLDVVPGKIGRNALRVLFIVLDGMRPRADQ